MPKCKECNNDTQAHRSGDSTYNKLCDDCSNNFKKCPGCAVNPILTVTNLYHHHLCHTCLGEKFGHCSKCDGVYGFGGFCIKCDYRPI